ncbi:MULTISPECIES: long-chain fatty acid--CoA ligase [unclassified Mesobacillus]|uniref:class I adenylate-forming enzyme family protein n=1 Tax=unclassified Mesobacillus TaxID=2675270 RepID=UPI00203F8DF7|nr:MULTISPECIES: long-chain fatty acid--CoA ligase [unclassified Mesobacillus]MCM3121584.1 long-chain fatty acid--CoA ligase [Mesobacillus sp. MER 33]MCM3231548.1 long-chain fatty acid--CoA ligase [Mesobacillus sp. MER 48]
MKLADLLENNISEYGEYPFIFYQDQEFSNVETKKYADQIANGLRKLGVENGDRVVVCMPNNPEVIFSYQGITRSGAVIVPIMFTLHPKEIQYIIKNCQAKVVIASAYTAENMKKAIAELEVKPLLVVADLPGSDEMVNLYDLMSVDSFANEENVHQNDTAVILYTSGTTGSPKGVLLTHKNLYTNAVNSAAHNETDRGVTIGVLPLAHVYGLTISNTCYLTGSSIVVFSRFDPQEIFKAIETYKVRSFSAVPAMIHAMVGSPKADQYDTSSLEWIGSGSAPLPIALLNGFRQRFDAKVLEGYGLSEAAPIVTAHNKKIDIKPGSVGIPIPEVQIKIIDDEGREVPTGDVGELLVSGDNVTPGYYQNKEETNRVIRDGWLHTGDMAKVDEDGYLFIVDRKKDLVIRGGFNIYPRDIEELLNAHESVSEAAVIGVPDERMGEEIVACVVRNPETDPSEEELIQYCQDHLARNKTPKRIVFMESLPRNGVGKILKTRLRETAANIHTH